MQEYLKSACRPWIPEQSPMVKRKPPNPMIVIGIDPHKSTHTATVVDAHTNKDLASLRIDATLKDYRRLLKWAQAWPQRRWAVENAEGLGRPFILAVGP